MAVDLITLNRRFEILLRELSGEQSPFFHSTDTEWFENSERTVVMPRGGAPPEPAESLQLIRVLLAPIGDDDVLRRAFWETCHRLLSADTAFAMAQVAVDMRMLGVIAGVSKPDVLEQFMKGVAARIVGEPATVPDELISEIHRLADVGRTTGLGLMGSERTKLIGATAKLERTVAFLEYLTVRRDILQGDNPELNTDKATLVSKYRSLGFVGPLEALLQKVDEAFSRAGDRLDFHGVMGLVRSALENIVEQSARHDAAAIAVDDALGQSPARFKRCSSTLERTGLLTQIESSALLAFYNMLSVEGAHAMGSAREQARLSKNMMIEWAVLVISRVRS